MGQDEVYAFIVSHPMSSKEEIADAVGCNPRSIHIYLGKLMRWGRISYRIAQRPNKMGRNISYYQWYAVSI